MVQDFLIIFIQLYNLLHDVLDDRYDIQEAVFMRWANSLVDGAVKELNDIVDTKFLSSFVQLITGEPFVSFSNCVEKV